MEDIKRDKHDDSALSGSRRSFLTGAATAAGVGALFPALRSFAQTGNGPRRIDVHHHFTPPAYLEFTRANGQGGGGGRGAGPVAVAAVGAAGGVIGSAYRGWTLEEDMADMDKSGTQVALLSITTPGFWFGKVDEVRTVSRQCNEYAAKLRSDHPGRFGSFATIPLADTDGALKETEYALDTLKADGIGLYSNYRDKWLGDSAFDPVYQELNRRKAVIYVHPVEADCCRNIVKDVFDTVVEYGADTTRTIASLILSGSTTRFPDIKWIFSHAGGMMPFVIERFETGTTAEIVPGVVTKGQGAIPPKNVPKGVLYELRKMYYDTAQSTNPVAMRALKEVAGVSQIVYGTDYWYRSSEETARGLTTDKVFSAEELKMINRGNAEKLLPKYHGT